MKEYTDRRIVERELEADKRMKRMKPVVRNTQPINEKLVNTYTDLLNYWSQPYRVIGASTRLNQSEEFIAEQRLHAEEMLKSLTNVS